MADQPLQSAQSKPGCPPTPMSTATSDTLRFQTPAKINTFLYIQNKRADGYHELLMDLIPVSFFDTIDLQKTRSGKLELVSNLENVELEENLVTKAVRLLERKCDCRFSLTIHLKKNIPSGAGLGGGSGNAGGMLAVLNSWFNLGLSSELLMSWALEIGADVPFFISPRPRLAQGIGEQLSDLKIETPLSLLLVYPGFPISTKQAYTNCRISSRQDPPGGYLPADFIKRSPDSNDFWNSLKSTYPELEQCQTALLEAGALYAGLSGSGSTVYAVFEDDASCLNAHSRIKKNPSWTSVTCRTLNNHIYT